MVAGLQTQKVLHNDIKTSHQRLRSSTLRSGAIVAIEKARNGLLVVIKPLRKRTRGWRQLWGLARERTGKPEWPTTEEESNFQHLSAGLGETIDRSYDRNAREE
jgi:hypothetical protein